MGWRFLSIIPYPRYVRIRPKFSVIVRTAAVRLSFKLLGDSLFPTDPPIIILHGLLGNKKHWESIGKTIHSLTRTAVITVDLRNHGDSPHVHSNKYPDLAEDVVRLLEDFGAKTATLLGHGMGGRTAMYVALTSPPRVASLIIVDMSPFTFDPAYIDDFPRLFELMKNVDFEKLEKKKVSKAIKFARKHLTGKVQEGIQMNNLLSNIDVRRDGKIGWTCNLEALIKSFKHIAYFPKMKGKQYMGPTLFIGGQFSEFMPADDLPGIRELFPTAVVTYIPNTGHYLFVDDPKGFLELVIAFVKANQKST